MHRPASLKRAILAAALIGLSSMSGGAAAETVWAEWDGALFARAKAENRFVLLDLEAVWCHWCHVMEETTYRDPAVVTLMAARYIPVRVDQDRNPDLSSRYGNWGWPATIVFAPDGTEIVKLRGYIPPERMAALLQAIIDDPSPGPSAVTLPPVMPAASAYLPPATRDRLFADWRSTFDEKNAGWGSVHKLILADNMDLALTLASAGDAAAEQMARRTFDQALNLIDPVWGGVYQYSDEPDWRSPHFEKIMSYQASYLRQLSEAYLRWGDARHLAAARAIQTYLVSFLRSPEGAFYVSQDADLDSRTDGHAFYSLDDAGRRKLGMPRIDVHLYARENGWAVSGLAAYYTATGDPEVLAAAERALDWVVTHRRLAGGGYTHDETDRGGPFLGDTIAVGQAALDLYAATGSRRWLATALAAGEFAGATFRGPDGGFVSAKTPEAGVGALAKPFVQFDETVAATRFFNLLARYSGRQADHALARHGMRYLASEELASFVGNAAGILLADAEVTIEPMHITVVGGKGDAAAAGLHRAARAMPGVYKRIDWWDRREGPMTNGDVTYPELDRAAAFACSNQVCSLPVLDPSGLQGTISSMLALRQEVRQD